MSKGLEALEEIKTLRGFNQVELNNDKNINKSLDVIEQAIQELQAIKSAEPSDAMECIKRMWDDIDAYNDFRQDFKDLKIIENYILKAQKQDELLKIGDLSDGYHTFNQLYYQRCILFASLVRLNKDKSWKSFKHSDGKYCFDSNGEWFIVGIDTPLGSYTYHYEKKYWDLFECQELECGKEWDGHTEEDVTRLLSLYNTQEQEKVLKIIKKKNVDILAIKESKTLEEYNRNAWEVEHYGRYKGYRLQLTEEEFNTVREWMK